MTCLQENLWVGSLDEAYSTDVICNVTHILNVAAEINISERVNHEYCKIGMNDDDDNPETLQSIIPVLMDQGRWIREVHERNGKVLIHCLKGKSRSICTAIYFLCLSGKMKSVDEALEFIRSKRPNIDIFPDYLLLLRRFVSVMAWKCMKCEDMIIDCDC